MQSRDELDKVSRDKGKRKDAKEKLPFFNRVVLSVLHNLLTNKSSMETRGKVAEPYFHCQSVEAAPDFATGFTMAGQVANVNLLNQFHLR
jgi:hypothetical protein